MVTDLGSEVGESKRPLVVKWLLSSSWVPKRRFDLYYTAAPAYTFARVGPRGACTAAPLVPLTILVAKVDPSEQAIYLQVDRAGLPAGVCHLVLVCGQEHITSGKIVVQRSGL
jgi:hypothetical protein